MLHQRTLFIHFTQEYKYSMRLANKNLPLPPNALRLPEVFSEKNPVYDILPAPEDHLHAPTRLTRVFDAMVAITMADANMNSGSIGVGKNRKTTRSGHSTPSTTNTTHTTGGGIFSELFGMPQTTTVTTSAIDMRAYEDSLESTSTREAVTNVTNVTATHLDQIIQTFIQAKNGDKDSPSLLMFASSSHTIRSSVMFMRLAQIAFASENIVRAAEHSEIETGMTTQYPLLIRSLIDGSEAIGNNALQWESHLSSLSSDSDLGMHKEMLRLVNRQDLLASFNVLLLLAHQSESGLAKLANAKIISLYHQILDKQEPDLAISVLNQIRKYSQEVVANSSSELRENNTNSIKRRDLLLISDSIKKLYEKSPEIALKLKSEYLENIPERALRELEKSYPDLQLSEWSEIISAYQDMYANIGSDDNHALTRDSTEFINEFLSRRFRHVLIDNKDNIAQINSEIYTWSELIDAFKIILRPDDRRLAYLFDTQISNLIPDLSQINSSELDLEFLIANIRPSEDYLTILRKILQLPFHEEVKKNIKNLSHDKLRVPIHPTTSYFKEAFKIKWTRKDTFNVEFPLASIINSALLKQIFVENLEDRPENMSSSGWPYPNDIADYVSLQQWKSTLDIIKQFEDGFKEKFPQREISAREPFLRSRKKIRANLSVENSYRKTYLTNASYILLHWLLGNQIIDGKQPLDNIASDVITDLINRYESN